MHFHEQQLMLLNENFHLLLNTEKNVIILNFPVYDDRL